MASLRARHPALLDGWAASTRSQLGTLDMNRSSEGSELLMSSALLAGSCFAIVTAPLALFGTQSLDLELGNIPIYQGRLEEVAPSYLGVSALVSVVLGVVGGSRSRVARSSSVGSSGSPTAISAGLKLPSAQMDSVSNMLSADQLQAAGLDFFLDDDSSDKVSPLEFQSVASTQTAESVIELVPSPMRAPGKGPANTSHAPVDCFVQRDSSDPEVWTLNFQPPIHDKKQGDSQSLVLEDWTEAFLSDSPLVLLTGGEAQRSQPAPDLSSFSPLGTRAELQPLNRRAVQGRSPHLQTLGFPGQEEGATSPMMPAAQAYVGFVQAAGVLRRPYSPQRNVAAELEALEQLQSVREQIQALSAQMELIQANLYPQAPNSKRLMALPSTPPKPSYVVSSMESSESFRYRLAGEGTSPWRSVVA